MAKLRASCTLGEITRHRQDVRLEAPEELRQRIGDPAIDAAEMQIGEMDERPHVVSTGAGTSTRSAPGRIRKESGVLAIHSSPSSDTPIRRRQASIDTSDAVSD